MNDMRVLIEGFNSLFPEYAAVSVQDGCSVKEEEAEEKANTFRHLIIKNFTGWQFDHFLIKKTSGLYQALWQNHTPQKRYDILCADCDGILCNEREDGVLTFYFVELKSSFHKQQILKAKDQVVGSSVKLMNLLALLQSYDLSRIRICGIIAAYEMNAEELSRFKTQESRDVAFCLKLYQNGFYQMPASRCQDYWSPLAVPDIQLAYIRIPAREREFTVDFSKLNLQ